MVEVAAGGEDVFEPAKPAESHGEEVEDAAADVADVEVVESEHAAEDGEEEVRVVAFLRGLGGLVAGLGGDVVDGLGVLVGGGGGHCAIFLSGGKPHHAMGLENRGGAGVTPS